MLIGTAGHVDHGKSTLVRALTGVEPDRLAEEQRRGISIELGFAPLHLPGSRLASLVDVPGHERLVKTMLVGASGITAALVVISAREGVMPQTREHLAALWALGVSAGVLAWTFTDQAEPPDAALDEALEGHPLAHAERVRVSAPTGQGLEALRLALGRLRPPPPSLTLPPWLAVDRGFSVPGFGTVVTGSLVQGTLAVGDEVALFPGPKARVRTLEVHGLAVEQAEAGQRVAVNLTTPWREGLRGALLAWPGAVAFSAVLDVELRWLPHTAEALTRKRGLTLHLAGGRASVEVVPDAPISPGGVGTARLRLDHPLAVPAGARFVLRGDPHPRFGAVLGGGRVLDPEPPKRRSAEARAALAQASGEDAAALLLAEAGRAGLEGRSLIRRCLVSRPPEAHFFAPQASVEALAALLAQVDAWHQTRPQDVGLPLARLSVHPLDRQALAQALSQGWLVTEGPSLRRPDHQPRLDHRGRALLNKLLKALGDAGLTGLTEEALCQRFPAGPEAVREALGFLVREGRAVRVDGWCFPGREINALARAAAERVLADGELPVSWLKAYAEVPRRQALALFRWLDQTGVTRRVGERRIPGERALRDEVLPKT